MNKMNNLHAFLLLLFLLAISCVQQDSREAQKTLTRLEYTRNADPGALAPWLNHRDPKIRQKAVQTLGKIQDEQQIALLANRLDDPDAAVRGAAIFALGQLFSAKAEPYLVEASQKETDKFNRLKLLEALGKSGTNKSANELNDFLGSNDPDFRKAAALSMGILAWRGFFPTEISPILGQMIADKDPETAWHGAYALYRIGALRSFEDFSAGLATPHPLARFFVLKGLERMAFLINSPQFKKQKNQPQYRDLLSQYNARSFRDQIAAQLQDSAWYVQVAALEALRTIKDDNYQQQIAALLDHAHPQVRTVAIRTMGAFKNWLTRKEMRRLYKDADDWRIKGEALVVLGLVTPAEALTHVKDELLNQPWPQTYYAIRTLDSLRTTDPRKPLKEEEPATRLLMQLADGITPAQTTAALEALVDRPKPPAVTYFIDKLKRNDLAITTVVASYLALIDTPKPTEAVAPLIDTFHKFEAPRDLEAMEPIITALDSIASQEAVPFLNEQLKNPYPSIREAAQRALVHITGKKNIPLPAVDEIYPVRMDFPPLSPDSNYSAIFKTAAGNFTIKLAPEKAPLTVANFVHLVKKKFYNGILFHRVVPGFVTQAGDPRGDGWGGPGYAILCEYNDLTYERGMVGMALAGKDTGGSQFFVTHTPQPHLNGRYTIFGEISEGLDIVDRVTKYDKIEQANIVVKKK